MSLRVAIALIVFSGAVAVPAAEKKNAWVDKTLRSMSADEKIGQVLIPVTWGGFKSVDSDEFQRLKNDVVQIGRAHV